jgi:thioredoxin-dependent peroxiredoxin
MKLVAIALILVVAGAVIVALRPRAASAAMLKEGDIAPSISTDAIFNDQIISFHLSDYRGHQVVLYFYPKDYTPGCTKEACAFRDGYARLQNWGIYVLGCSVDSANAHRGFIRKYRLPFPLLLDPDKKIAKAYGADNGIPILGLDQRVTYVIGADGRILKVYPEVDPGTHARQIIHDLGADKPRPTPTPTAKATPTPTAHAARPARSPESSDDDSESQ